MNKNVKQALEDMEYVRQTSKDRRGHYKGEELGELKCQEVPQFPGITNMNELYAVLRKCWRADTAYPDCQKDWEPSDPTYGQCAITAALVNDMFGGSIHRLALKGGGSHYINKINELSVFNTKLSFKRKITFDLTFITFIGKFTEAAVVVNIGNG